MGGTQLAEGASTAWVPSPTAATLHALHYMRTNVKDVHAGLTGTAERTSSKCLRGDLLCPPLMGEAELRRLRDAPNEVQAELDDNIQSLLGYVVRWVGQRIANWMLHRVVSDEQVLRTLRRVAVLVDEQNA